MVGLDDDADTDDQEEDQECRPLLCHPRPHLAPAESESAGWNWGNQRWDSPYRAKVKCPSCRVLSTCDCFVSAPRAPADSLNLILCDPVIVFWAIFPRCLCCDVGPVTAAGPTGRHARSTLIYAGACHSCTPIGETSANRPWHAHTHTCIYTGLGGTMTEPEIQAIYWAPLQSRPTARPSCLGFRRPFRPSKLISSQLAPRPAPNQTEIAATLYRWDKSELCTCDLL